MIFRKIIARWISDFFNSILRDVWVFVSCRWWRIFGNDVIFDRHSCKLNNDINFWAFLLKKVQRRPLTNILVDDEFSVIWFLTGKLKPMEIQINSERFHRVALYFETRWTPLNFLTNVTNLPSVSRLFRKLRGKKKKKKFAEIPFARINNIQRTNGRGVFRRNKMRTEERGNGAVRNPLIRT